jgi:UDP-glucose 4-epimerase
VLLADPTKASELLGWRPRHAELDTMVSHAWAWQAKRAS